MSDDELHPEGFRANGEPAPTDDIQLMERVALDILAAVPVEEHRQYVIDTESGQSVLFRTFRSENDPPGALYAGIVLACEDIDDPQFEVVCGSDNAPFRIGYNSLEELQSAQVAAQMVLKSGELNTSEAAALRYAMEVMFWVEKFLHGQEIDKVPEGASYINTTIREQVDDKSPVTVRVREFCRELKDGSEINVVEHIIGEGDDTRYLLLEKPRLQIDYADAASGTNYCYARYENGEVSLESYDPSAVDDEPFACEYTDEDLAVMALMEVLHPEEPGKTHVDLIIEKLLDAGVEDFFENTSV